MGQVKLVSRWRDHLNAMSLRSGPDLIKIWWSRLRRNIRQIFNGFPGLGKVLLMNAARSLQDEHSRWLCTCVLERMWHTVNANRDRQRESDPPMLPISEEKTRITNARTEEALFLGTTLTIGKGGEAKVVQQKTSKGKTIQRRSTGWATIMKAPMDKLLKRLKERGFCTATGEPLAKGLWTTLDADQSIQLYSSVNRGLQNYYRLVDNWKQCARIQYILKFSLAKTLAQKYKLSVPQVFKRFGKELSVLIKGRGGKPDRQVSFYQNQDWTKNKLAFQVGNQDNRDVVRTLVRLRTRSKLGMPCCICGECRKQIEMHHVRHLRKLSNKRVATGFNRLLRAMNRKQVPVCSDCHRKIHRGEYNGLKLSHLAYLPG